MSQQSALVGLQWSASGLLCFVVALHGSFSSIVKECLSSSVQGGLLLLNMFSLFMMAAFIFYFFFDLSTYVVMLITCPNEQMIGTVSVCVFFSFL